ncbi:MAG TPA: hypothetical protein VM184_06500 [Gaiellaceae bacterium]|nr:hypothetical protein [Gaiellaceae bacterium]
MGQVLRRVAFVLAIAFASLAGFAGGAAAHTLANAGNVYDSGNQCVHSYTSQAHTYNSVIVQSLTNTPPYHFPVSNCTYRNSKPDGYLAARWDSWKWGSNVGAWVLCGSQGWNYGGGYELQVGRSTTGCGGGYYLVAGGTYVYNGGWVGGWLTTGYEWLW